MIQRTLVFFLPLLSKSFLRAVSSKDLKKKQKTKKTPQKLGAVFEVLLVSLKYSNSALRRLGLLSLDVLISTGDAAHRLAHPGFLHAGGGWSRRPHVLKTSTPQKKLQPHSSRSCLHFKSTARKSGIWLSKKKLLFVRFSWLFVFWKGKKRLFFFYSILQKECTALSCFILDISQYWLSRLIM